jgi:hypothetical protein
MYGVGETPLTLRGRWTQLDPDTVQITLEDNGQRIPETMTLVVSNDRAAMTKTIERADAQGNQTKDVIAYTSAP